jgi:hypothetical protein
VATADPFAGIPNASDDEYAGTELETGQQQRRTYPGWSSGVPMLARDLTDYPEALDEPHPEGTPSRTARQMAALIRDEPVTGTAASGFTPGQEVIWTGSRDLFAHRATIVRARRSWLMIFGETPADARTVYDVADSVSGVTVLGIPAGQLHPAGHDHGGYEDMDEARVWCPACRAEG